MNYKCCKQKKWPMAYHGILFQLKSTLNSNLYLFILYNIIYYIIILLYSYCWLVQTITYINYIKNMLSYMLFNSFPHSTTSFLYKPYTNLLFNSYTFIAVKKQFLNVYIIWSIINTVFRMLSPP